MLYLGKDRPNKIRRAMRRQLAEEHRDLFDERIIVWEGLLRLGLNRIPELPLDTVQSAQGRAW